MKSNSILISLLIVAGLVGCNSGGDGSPNDDKVKKFNSETGPLGSRSNNAALKVESSEAEEILTSLLVNISRLDQPLSLSGDNYKSYDDLLKSAAGAQYKFKLRKEIIVDEKALASIAKVKNEIVQYAIGADGRLVSNKKIYAPNLSSGLERNMPMAPSGDDDILRRVSDYTSDLNNLRQHVTGKNFQEVNKQQDAILAKLAELEKKLITNVEKKKAEEEAKKTSFGKAVGQINDFSKTAYSASTVKGYLTGATKGFKMIAKGSDTNAIVNQFMQTFFANGATAFAGQVAGLLTNPVKGGIDLLVMFAMGSFVDDTKSIEEIRFEQITEKLDTVIKYSQASYNKISAEFGSQKLSTYISKSDEYTKEYLGDKSGAIGYLDKLFSKNLRSFMVDYETAKEFGVSEEAWKQLIANKDPNSDLQVSLQTLWDKNYLDFKQESGASDEKNNYGYYFMKLMSAQLGGTNADSSRNRNISTNVFNEGNMKRLEVIAEQLSDLPIVDAFNSDPQLGVSRLPRAASQTPQASLSSSGSTINIDALVYAAYNSVFHDVDSLNINDDYKEDSPVSYVKLAQHGFTKMPYPNLFGSMLLFDRILQNIYLKNLDGLNKVMKLELVAAQIRYLHGDFTVQVPDGIKNNPIIADKEVLLRSEYEELALRVKNKHGLQDFATDDKLIKDLQEYKSKQKELYVLVTKLIENTYVQRVDTLNQKLFNPNNIKSIYMERVGSDLKYPYLSIADRLYSVSDLMQKKSKDREILLALPAGASWWDLLRGTGAFSGVQSKSSIKGLSLRAEYSKATGDKSQEALEKGVFYPSSNGILYPITEIIKDNDLYLNVKGLFSTLALLPISRNTDGSVRYGIDYSDYNKNTRYVQNLNICNQINVASTFKTGRFNMYELNLVDGMLYCSPETFNIQMIKFDSENYVRARDELYLNLQSYIHPNIIDTTKPTHNYTRVVDVKVVEPVNKPIYNYLESTNYFYTSKGLIFNSHKPFEVTDKHSKYVTDNKCISDSCIFRRTTEFLETKVNMTVFPSSSAIPLVTGQGIYFMSFNPAGGDNRISTTPISGDVYTAGNISSFRSVKKDVSLAYKMFGDDVKMEINTSHDYNKIIFDRANPSVKDSERLYAQLYTIGSVSDINDVWNRYIYVGFWPVNTKGRIDAAGNND